MLEKLALPKKSFSRPRSSSQRQIEIDLDTLDENFRLQEIPLPEEEEAFEKEKERLNGQLLKLYDAARLALERRGAAWNAELRHGGNYAQLQHAHTNAKTLADGAKLGVIEGGIAAVK